MTSVFYGFLKASPGGWSEVGPGDREVWSCKWIGGEVAVGSVGELCVHPCLQSSLPIVLHCFSAVSTHTHTHTHAHTHTHRHARTHTHH